nr:uncharacterized mitochondrial protein AtMg00810-like [Tanacetum cinerariifolium]
MILESVKHDQLIWSTIEENGVTFTKKYDKLSAAEKIQANCDMQATNIILQGLVVRIFSLGYDPIACLNKAMDFRTIVDSSRFPSTNNQFKTSLNLRNQATIQDGRVTVQKVQERQGQSYSGTGYKSNATSSKGNNASGEEMVVKCYNCQACYTQNCSLIRLRYNKTPYELMQDKKPDLSFFYVFASLCYPTDDNDDVGLVPNTISQQPFIPQKRDDWDCLFQPMFDEYLNPLSIAISPIQEAVAPRTVVLADSPVLTFVDQDAPSTRSSSNVRQTHTPFEHLGRWTKDHLIANVIDDPSRPVSTRTSNKTSNKFGGAKPIKKHLNAVKQIFRYLKGTINMGLWYSKDTGMSLTADADADLAGCQDTRRSTSGSAQFLGDKLVSWSSKKQKSIAISSTEAKYIAYLGVVLKSHRCVHS